MTIQEPTHRHHSRRGRAATLLRCAVAGLLGVLAAVLISCGTSGAGLIPPANAGPLQSDFEAIAQAAQSGNGSCEATQAAIAKTERDFQALPSSVNGGLRNTLRQGITNLRARALAACAQPLPQSTVTTNTTKTTPTTTTTQTTPTTTQTTPTDTTPTTTPTTPTTTGPEGGTPAPNGAPAPGGTEPGSGGQEGGK